MEQLNEMSSITRVLKHMEKYDTACLTAYRDAYCNATENTLDDRPTSDAGQYRYTEDDNKKRNRDLSAALLKFGYGVTRIDGTYIENFGTDESVEVGEASLFVVNLNDDKDFYANIFRLSELYNQDCFLYKAKNDSNGYLIGTNMCEFPGYGNKILSGSLHVNIINEFRTRIKSNTFSFTQEENPEADNNRRESFAERKKRRREELIDALGLKVYESYGKGARMSINALYEGVRHRLNNTVAVAFDDLTLLENYII